MLNQHFNSVYEGVRSYRMMLIITVEVDTNWWQQLRCTLGWAEISNYTHLKRIEIMKLKDFNIFQVFPYFTIYRRYFALKFEHFHEYVKQYSLKSGGTKYCNHCKRVTVPGTSPYWKTCKLLLFFVI
jgi:hypothetical protein